MSLRLELDEVLERKFREVAMRKFGYSKGALLKASTVALSKWVAEEGKPIRSVKDPIKLIDGILSKYKGKYTSVELQHQTAKIWAKRVR